MQIYSLIETTMVHLSTFVMQNGEFEQDIEPSRRNRGDSRTTVRMTVLYSVMWTAGQRGT